MHRRHGSALLVRGAHRFPGVTASDRGTLQHHLRLLHDAVHRHAVDEEHVGPSDGGREKAALIVVGVSDVGDDGVED